jgi:hypothetical protein
MFLKNVKKYYALPAVFMGFGKGFSGGYDEYVKSKNDKPNISLAQHTVYSIMGLYCGAVSGAFLGLTWPISLPIFIGRCLDKNNKKE